MFKFKLQAVLDHRQLIEDNIQKELAEIKQQLIGSQKKLETLINKETDTMHILKREQTKGLSSHDVIAYQDFLKDLSKRITLQRKAIDEICEQEEETKKALREAVKQKQILEKLKEQGMDRYHRNMLKKEQEFIDEIAVNKFVRSSLENSGEE